MSRARRRTRHTVRGRGTATREGIVHATAARPASATGPCGDSDQTASPATPATASSAEPVPAGSGRAEASLVGAAGLVPETETDRTGNPAQPVATGTVPPGTGRRCSPEPRPRTVRARISAVGRRSVARTGVLVVGGLGAATAVTSTAAWGMATLIAPGALPRPGIWLTVSATVIVLEVVLGSCLTALVGCLYNLTAPYDGGVEISLTDDQGQNG